MHNTVSAETHSNSKTFEMEKETFEVGMCFSSYEELSRKIKAFSLQTKCKFWKRDARTITAVRSSGVYKFLNPALIYYEIRYWCVFGGIEFKSRSKNIRAKSLSLKTSNCPAFMRFKANVDGHCLQLVTMNLNHNHELSTPRKKYFKNQKQLLKKSELNEILEMENIEVQEQEKYVYTSEIQQASLKEEGYDNNFIHEKTLEEIENQEGDYCEVNTSNKVSFTFRGLIAPVFAPLQNDGFKSLNLEIIPAYANYLYNSNIKGVLVNGTSGEGMCLTTEERKLITEKWASSCTDLGIHMMVQVGGTCLPNVLELAQHAEEVGVDSLLCLPELYHKPANDEELINYLKEVAKVAPNTPLLYYHIPYLTNVNINMGTFLNKVGDHIPTFAGIKFTSTLLDEGLAALNARNKAYAVFLGADVIMSGAFALGFDSAISTSINMFPSYSINILESTKKGDFTRALKTQEKLNAAINIITKNGTWVPTMKEAMNLMAPFQVGPPRQPLIELNLLQIKEMENELSKLQDA